VRGKHKIENGLRYQKHVTNVVLVGRKLRSVEKRMLIKIQEESGRWLQRGLKLLMEKRLEER